MFLQQNDIHSTLVKKPSQPGRPQVLKYIETGRMDLVIVIPVTHLI